MFSRAFMLILSLTIMLSLCSIGAAQETVVEGFQGPSYHLEGSDIPLYFVVESFFETMIDLSKKWDESYELFLAEHMGIEPGSTADAALLDAVHDAEPILSAPNINMDLIGDEQAFGAYQYNALKRKALGLREIHLKLVEKLELQGYSSDKLNEFLDREFRHGMSLTTVGVPFEASVGAVVKVFEDPDFGSDESLIFQSKIPD